MPRSRRCGYTLIEFLVIIAIMAILTALMLPAVLSAREAARRSTCRNHLRQLGLAMFSYHDAFESLPSGVVNRERPIMQTPRGDHQSWIVSLLPYLDQSLLAEKLDTRKSIYADVNLAARQHVLSGLLCPSDPVSSRSRENLGAVALSNYAGVHHHLAGAIDVPNQGVLFLNSRISRDDIIDGSSTTFLAGEIKRHTGDFGWASGTRGTLRNTGTPLNRSPGSGMYAEESRARPVGTPVPGDLDRLKGNTSMSDYFGSDENPERPPAVPLATDNALDPGGFGSHHPAGAHFLMCDGVVRFLSENIDTELYQRLAHRADQSDAGHEF